MSDTDQAKDWVRTRARLAKPIAARSGSTHAGMPLSLNRAPAADLAPWIARIVVTRIDAPPECQIEGGLCSDLAFQRVIIDGSWEDRSGDKVKRYDRGSILIGPHSQHLRVGCVGPISTVGIGFRPGAMRALWRRDMTALVDRIELGDPLGLLGENDDHGNDGAKGNRDAEDFGYSRSASPDEWASIAERRARAYIARAQPKPPDPVSAAFETASFADPNIGPGDFARAHGVNQRRLERLVKRDFGHTPRFVLRRARALDLAAQLLGIADASEEAEFLLRYFDQAHLIREFQAFFGVTPQTFRQHPRMLMTMNLETRSARRLEELDRLRPGEPRPWAQT